MDDFSRRFAQQTSFSMRNVTGSAPQPTGGAAAGPITGARDRDSAETPTVPGAQTIARAAAVLAELGRDGGSPKRTAHIARVLGLSEPTATRILLALSANGLAERASTGGPWRLGPETDALAASRGRYSTRFWSEVDGSLLRLIETFGIAASFWLLSGTQRVCVRRMDSASAPQWVGDHVGDRLPLWQGAGGIAWLAATSESTDPATDLERDAVLGAARGRLGPDDFSGFVGLIDQARAHGVSVDGTRSAHGYTAASATVTDPDDRIIGTLVLTQEEHAMTGARRTEIIGLLRDEVRRVGYALVRPYEASLR